jgi:hypothetical protein
VQPSTTEKFKETCHVPSENIERLLHVEGESRMVAQWIYSTLDLWQQREPYPWQRENLQADLIGLRVY